MMANIKIKINNPEDLDVKLPKLRRSLKAQTNIELQEDNDSGVFKLVIKENVTPITLKTVKGILDMYGFTFYYQEVEGPISEDVAEMCTCAACQNERKRARGSKGMSLKELLEDAVRKLNENKR